MFEGLDDESEKRNDLVNQEFIEKHRTSNFSKQVETLTMWLRYAIRKNFLVEHVDYHITDAQNKYRKSFVEKYIKNKNNSSYPKTYSLLKDLNEIVCDLGLLEKEIASYGNHEPLPLEEYENNAGLTLKREDLIEQISQIFASIEDIDWGYFNSQAMLLQKDIEETIIETLGYRPAQIQLRTIRSLAEITLDKENIIDQNTIINGKLAKNIADLSLHMIDRINEYSKTDKLRRVSDLYGIILHEALQSIKLLNASQNAYANDSFFSAADQSLDMLFFIDEWLVVIETLDKRESVLNILEKGQEKYYEDSYDYRSQWETEFNEVSETIEEHLELMNLDKYKMEEYQDYINRSKEIFSLQNLRIKKYSNI